MYKEGLALNNLQWLIWHKTQPTLLKGISLKVNLMERLEFELTERDVAVKHFNHFAKKTPYQWLWDSILHWYPKDLVSTLLSSRTKDAVE